ncbi:ABC transporter permease [Ekhidna sp. To15]|uniref:ABC transporter permease n=1 Tax=Ekhidna sp. To15 TaxID=3395267 RepID=UPI003F5289A0
MIKRLADKLFKWYCHPDFYPDIKGDLEELYTDHLEDGSRFPQLRYLLDVMLLFRISLLRPILKNSIIKDTGMFRNYFKVSVRNLARHKMFTAINVIGLAIGLASFLLMYEYIKFEKSYDAFHPDSDKIYRVSYVQVQNGMDTDKDAMAAYPMGQKLEESLPEIIQHTVSKKFDFLLVRNGEKSFKERLVISADPNFLKMFNYSVLEGDVESMLSEPLSVVLTESRARAYFGDTEAIGKTLEVVSPYKVSLKVTGILQDIPDNTHYSFNMLLSDKTLTDGHDYNNWDWNNYYVYIKSDREVNPELLEAKANDVANEHINNLDNDENWETNGTRIDVHPVRDIHLKSDFTYEPQIHGSEKAVDFLIIISLFILVIAWVNYINLSTARAVERAKEVGLRKVIGAIRKQLIIQFLCEAFIVNLISALIALGLAEITLPYFNQLVGKEVLDSVLNQLPFLLSILAFVFIGTFASGFYPALVLSNFKPISILKGNFQNSKKGIALRKGLVITQFAASLILIASTFTIYQQVSYMQGKDIGISVDQVVNVTVPESDAETEEEDEAAKNKLRAFKKALANHSSIESVGGASNLPGGDVADINSTTTVVRFAGDTEPTEGTTYVQYNDEGFLDAVDMELVAGRNFSEEIKSDSVAVMANEAFLRRLNVPDFESVVGKKLQFGTRDTNTKYTLIGVVKDFNRTTLKEQVEPSLYFPWFNADDLVIELSSSDYNAGLDHIMSTWKEFYADAPLNYSFLDDRFASLYEQDRSFGDTFMIFAILAVFIAILGLYGLASFMSIQKSKEIGVRKVLGASEGQIIFLFYKDFFTLVALSSLVGFPVVYFLMDGWLDNYAYRISFPWILLGISLFIVLVFSLVTVGYQTLKVAKLDPAETLKYE